MMSRNIDFNKPLSEEDAKYVQDRPWMKADAEIAGITIRYAADGDDTGSDDTDSDDDDSDDEVEDYEGWVKKDLLAEIASRNEERDDDDQITPDSEKNEDLIAALLADDQAEDDDEDDESGE